MLPPKADGRTNPLLFWQDLSLAPQQADVGLSASDLIQLSARDGTWNGLLIGAAYAGILGFVTFYHVYPQLPFVWLLLGPILGCVFGGVIGAIVGLLFGLLCGVVSVILARLSFWPLRDRMHYRSWAGLLNIPLVIGSFYLWAMASPSIYEFFRSYFGYVPVLVICIYSWFHAGNLAREYALGKGALQESRLLGPYSDLYDERFQERLFSTLSQRYDQTTRLVSLGLSDGLRARLVKRMHLMPGMAVCDLMTGGGEVWPHLLPQIGPDGSITAVDCTPEMLKLAQERLDQLHAGSGVVLHKADACATGLPDESFDAVVCAYGLTTLTPPQFDALVQEVHRILRPGGIFGFVELSRPGRWPLRHLMDIYLTSLVLPLSQLVGADCRPYLLLNEYLAHFDNGRRLLSSFRARGCICYRYEFVGGCATVIVGMKDSPRP